MKLERFSGFVAGRKTIDGTSTWVVRVKQDGHPLNGKKLVVSSVGPNVWELRKGDNVTFGLQVGKPEDMASIMACDVLPDKGRTLNRLERLILDYRGGSPFYGADMVFMLIMWAMCGGVYCYLYTFIPRSRFSNLPDPMWAAGVTIFWVLTIVYTTIMFAVFWGLLIDRLQQLLDYNRRDSSTTVCWEFGFNASLTLGLAVFFYFEYGALNGFPAGAGWPITMVLKHIITFMLGFPLAVAAFLTATAPWGIRGKSKPLFSYELNN